MTILHFTVMIKLFGLDSLYSVIVHTGCPFKNNLFNSLLKFFFAKNMLKYFYSFKKVRKKIKILKSCI